MLKTFKPPTSPSRSTTNSAQAVQHHRVRTFFASTFGMIALLLIFISILAVWLNRTLTDTTTYVSTVSPLVTKPAVQNFVVDTVSTQLLDNAPLPDLAATLLPGANETGATNAHLKATLRPIITRSVLQIIQSPAFGKLWTDTNRSAHQQLVQQLDSNSPQIIIDFSPLATGIVDQLKTTQLSPVSDKIDIKPDSAKVNIKGGSIDKLHKFYVLFKKATLAIVGATALAIALCVLISVHHTKTARRILFGTGVISLLMAFGLEAPSFISLHGSDPVKQAAIVAIAQTLLHHLQVACLILGVSCIFLALVSKILAVRSRPKLA